MTKSSFTFLKVRGIPIGAHWTWSLVFLLLTRTLATDYFVRTAPDLAAGTYVALALLTSLLFFTSIVLHELGHAFRALREGMQIDGITLWLFGGVARFTGMFPSPGAELRVAIAGPAVSLVITLVMWAVTAGADALGLPAGVEAVAGYLAKINGILVAFNLVPALPLDGGRVLRAILWRRQQSYTAATISASRAGRAFAFVLIGLGIAGLLSSQVASGSIAFAFIGWFLLQAAGAETQYALMLRALDPLTAGDLLPPSSAGRHDGSGPGLDGPHGPDGSGPGSTGSVVPATAGGSAGPVHVSGPAGPAGTAPPGGPVLAGVPGASDPSGVLVVSPDTTIARFLEAIANEQRREAYAVVADGRLDGLLSLKQAAGVSRGARDRTTVSDVMLPREKVAVLEHTAPALDVVHALQAGAPAAVVTSRGTNGGQRIEGTLTVSDVVRGVQREASRVTRTEPPARSAGVAIWAVVVFAMTVCVAAIYHPPYVVISPGPAIDLSHDVQISGVPTHPVDGRYLLVSVRLSSPSALSLGIAALRPDREIVPWSSVSAQGQDQIKVFEQSRQYAAAAAAKAAGLDVKISGTGARVVQAVRGTPAFGVLRDGDVIVSIDGKPVLQDADVRSAIRSRREGTTFQITVERSGGQVTVPVRSAEVQQSGQGVAAIGVFLETRDFDIDLPFDVAFKKREGIGGPSAGLAYALVIADMLEPGDLSRDRTIAATGTIDVQGGVGEIGGINEKAYGAKDKDATVFVVPAKEASDVHLEGLKIHGVTTLDQALSALRAPS